MQAAAQQRLAAQPLARRQPRLQRVASSGNGAGPLPVQAKLTEGARIRVTAPVKVFHVGKFKDGLELQGMEATVLSPDVRDYKHHDGKQHELSANLPVKVQLSVPSPEGKAVKVIAHLSEDELEAL